jgi:hypothetical protein
VHASTQVSTWHAFSQTWTVAHAPATHFWTAPSLQVLESSTQPAHSPSRHATAQGACVGTHSPASEQRSGDNPSQRACPFVQVVPEPPVPAVPPAIGPGPLPPPAPPLGELLGGSKLQAANPPPTIEPKTKSRGVKRARIFIPTSSGRADGASAKRTSGPDGSAEPHAAPWPLLCCRKCRLLRPASETGPPPAEPHRDCKHVVK